MKNLSLQPEFCLRNQFRGKRDHRYEQWTPNAELRLLLVENSVHDELAIINELHCGGFEVIHKRVDTTTDFEVELDAEDRWDLVICDHCLRGVGGLKILQLYQQSGLDIPFIMVSALVSDSEASTVRLAGARDFLMKQNLSGLVPAIKRELRAAHERNSLRLAAVAHWQLISSSESSSNCLGLCD